MLFSDQKIEKKEKERKVTYRSNRPILKALKEYNIFK